MLSMLYFRIWSVVAYSHVMKKEISDCEGTLLAFLINPGYFKEMLDFVMVDRRISKWDRFSVRMQEIHQSR